MQHEQVLAETVNRNFISCFGRDHSPTGSRSSSTSRMQMEPCGNLRQSSTINSILGNYITIVNSPVQW